MQDTVPGVTNICYYLGRGFTNIFESENNTNSLRELADNSSSSIATSNGGPLGGAYFGNVISINKQDIDTKPDVTFGHVPPSDYSACKYVFDPIQLAMNSPKDFAKSTDLAPESPAQNLLDAFQGTSSFSPFPNRKRSPKVKEAKQCLGAVEKDTTTEIILVGKEKEQVHHALDQKVSTFLPKKALRKPSSTP